MANISLAPSNLTKGVPAFTGNDQASKPSDSNQQLLNIIQQLVSDLGASGGHASGEAAEDAAPPSAGSGPGALAAPSEAASPSVGGAGMAGDSATTQQLTQAIGDLAKIIGQQSSDAGGMKDLTQAVADLAKALAQQTAGAAAPSGAGPDGPGNAGTDSQLAKIIGELAQALQAQTSGGAGQAMGGLGGEGEAGAGGLGNTAGADGITGRAMPSADPVSAAAQQLAQAMQSQGDTPQGMDSPVPAAIGQLAQALSAQTGTNRGITENQIVQALAHALNPGMGDNGSGAVPPAVANAIQQVFAALEGQGAPAAPSPQAMPSIGGAGGMDAPSGSGDVSRNGMGGGDASNALMKVLNELVQMLEAQMAMQSAGNNPLASAVMDLTKALAA